MINYPSSVNFGDHFINNILVGRQDLPCLLERSKQLFHESFEELQETFKKEKRPPRLVTEKTLFSYCPRLRDQFYPNRAKDQGFFQDDIDEFKSGVAHIFSCFARFVSVINACEKHFSLPERAESSEEKIREILLPFENAARKYDTVCTVKGREHPALSEDEAALVEYPLVYILFQAAAVMEEFAYWDELVKQFLAQYEVEQEMHVELLKGFYRRRNQ